MKQIGTFTIVLFSLLNGLSQESTLQAIQRYQKDDSIKVEMIVDYCVNSTFNQNSQILQLAEKANAISKKIGYALGEVHSLSCIGNYYYLVADYPKAVSFYNQSLQLAEKLKSTDNIIIGYNNLANLYNKAKQPLKAIELFKQCDKLLVEKGDSVSQHRAAILVNLSDVFNSIQQSSKAIFYLKQALEISEKIKSDVGLIICNSNLGAIHVEDRKYEAALPFLENAYQRSNAVKNNFLLPQIEVNLGICFAHFGQRTKAEKFHLSAIQHALVDQNREVLVVCYDQIQRFYEQQRRFEKAHAYLKKYTQLKEEIAGVETQQIISEINTKYATEKKESKIKSLNLANTISKLESKQKTDWIIGIVGAVFVLVICTLFLFSRFKNKKKNELLEIQVRDAQMLLESERKASESEVKAIKSQMNPHFFYNALNSIQGFVLTGEKLKAVDSIGLFSDLSRAVLESSRQKEISLYDEIELLKAYLKLEQMRLPKIQFELNVHENVQLYDCFLPPMILQPIIENSVKHGLANKEKGGLISISFSQDRVNLYVSIDDDGIGRIASAALNRFSKKFASFSSEANQNRIELLNEIYGLEIKQVITDKIQNGLAGGTRVELTFPQQ